MTPVAGARGLAVAAAVLFSTGGAAIKTGAFGALQVSSTRSAIAALALLIFVQGRVRVDGSILAAGVAYAATLTLFVAATKLTTAANAIFLQSTAPLYLLVLGPWVLKEQFRRQDLGYVLAMAAGLIVCFLGQPAATTTAPNPPLGNLLGLASSLTWAATLVGLRHVSRAKDGGLSAVVVGNVVAAVLTLPFAFPFPAAPPMAWLGLVYLGVVQIGLAYICLTRSLDRLPALEVSLLLLLEPVLNPVWTWLVRGERPGAWVLAGGTLILAASSWRATTGVWGQTGVRPGSDRGQTGVRPGSDQGQTPPGRPESG
ncbi:MAG: DMT family transporter [Vicinamibacterales bacterium]